MSPAKKRFSFVLLIFPALLIYLFVMILPLLVSLGASFSGPSVTGGRAVFAGLAHYRALFASPAFWGALKNNAVLAAVSVFVQIPLGFFTAYLLSRRFERSAPFFCGLFFFPAVLSPVLTGLLGRFALPGVMFSHPLLPVLVITSWAHTGFFTAVFLVNLRRIDESVLEAARIDGAGEGTILFSILLPAQKRVILICSLLALVFSLRSFDSGRAFSGGAGLFSDYLYSAAFGKGPERFLAAPLASLLALASIILMILLNRAARRPRGYRS
ncbi:MAG: sugar ABC transporter permease [Treponema sp.]|jgi:ABC-type sugar transport system permease subunit|nr:sugar ABC transporter permease [Treponema sp.]